MTGGQPAPETWAAIAAAGLDPAAAVELIRRTLSEDSATGEDPTSTATIPPGQQGELLLRPRVAGVVAGIPLARAAFEIVDPAVVVTGTAADGDRVTAGQVLLSAGGSTRSLLRAERTALNLLCHLSGIATLTAQWVAAVAGTGVVVRDTRKTLPGLRAVEKYAVRCGGGANHRLGLTDAALVKDNHIAAAGGVAAAFAAVRATFPGLPVEVEVDTLDQLDEAIAAGVDLILLDNFDLPRLRQAVARVGGRAQLEASGGLRLADAAAVAASGVDYLAVGALTHSAPALDIGADLV